MIRSMTGFGSASTSEPAAGGGNSHYAVEVRTLNSKFFKAVVRLPDELSELETDIENTVRKHVTRGTVTIIADWSGSAASCVHRVDRAALEHYLRELHGIALSESTTSADAHTRFDVAALISLPGVLVPPVRTPEEFERLRTAYTELTERACASLLTMRTTEGQRLHDELALLTSQIREGLEVIRGRAPDVARDYESRLRQRIDRLLTDAGIPAEPVDIIREVAAFAERTDINEEISRLGAHLDHFAEHLTQDDPKPVGRTLDFLSQELLREANTIASKTPDATVSRVIIDIKGRIDRIKELVQNVE